MYVPRQRKGEYKPKKRENIRQFSPLDFVLVKSLPDVISVWSDYFAEVMSVIDIRLKIEKSLKVSAILEHF